MRVGMCVGAGAGGTWMQQRGHSGGKNLHTSSLEGLPLHTQPRAAAPGPRAGASPSWARGRAVGHQFALGAIATHKVIDQGVRRLK